MDKNFGYELQLPHCRIQLSSDVMTQRIGNEMVLVHLKTNRIYDLNVTAARLWELMSVEDTLSKIQGQMLEEFEVDEKVLHSEVQKTLAAMKKEGLLIFHD